MRVSDHCRRAGVAIESDADIVAAAKLMREKHVGFLAVFRRGDDMRRPIGVLTDRDIVLEVTARDVDPHAITVSDAMSVRPVIARDTDELADLVSAMRLAGVRRVPVVDARGALIGVIAVDDAIAVLTALLSEVCGSIASEQRNERRQRQALHSG